MLEPSVAALKRVCMYAHVYNEKDRNLTYYTQPLIGQPPTSTLIHLET